MHPRRSGKLFHQTRGRRATQPALPLRCPRTGLESRSGNGPSANCGWDAEGCAPTAKLVPAALHFVATERPARTRIGLNRTAWHEVKSGFVSRHPGNGKRPSGMKLDFVNAG